MPRLQPIDPAEAEGKTKELFGQAEQKMGAVPNVIRTMGNSPAVLQGYLQLSGALAEGELPGPVREQIALLVSQKNGCDYCLSAHTAIGKQMGLSDEEATDARRGKADDAKTQGALDFAAAVFEKRGWVEDEDLRAVRGAGWGDGAIAEIVANVVVNFYTNYFNHVADTEVDFPQAPKI